MGSASSKVARKLPKAPKPPLRTVREREILNEDKDAHLMANLSRLDPVRVDHHMKTVKAAEDRKRMFSALAESEEQAAQAQLPRNRTDAMGLSNLLNEIKGVEDRERFAKIAEEYGVQSSKLGSLCRFVASPSVTTKSERAIWIA